MPKQESSVMVSSSDDGNVGSIAREKDQVKEVKEGLECGITIENYNDIKEKDIIEAYEIVLKK